MKKTIKNNNDDYSKLENKARKLEALVNLSESIRKKETQLTLSFNDFLYTASEKPVKVFRNIFQIFYDMLHHYIPTGKDEYEGSKDTIGFKKYDCSNLFVENCDAPFFADRLFANRLMKLSDKFKQGTQNNHIFLFEGPPGSGKSTFLNNILSKLEDYTKTSAGRMYEISWKLDLEKLGGLSNLERRFDKINRRVFDKISSLDKELTKGKNTKAEEKIYKKYLEFSCPNHDHPILLIPKDNRKQFIEELISEQNVKDMIFNNKEYDWILKDIPCSICNSLYHTLMDQLDEPMDLFEMVNVKSTFFNRQFGDGISIFNPGDRVIRNPIVNVEVQKAINELVTNDNNIKYQYSYLAKTNNGVMGLMDIKENNIERLKSLHGIISDGVHKVELSEEKIKTLFIGLVNPKDKVHYENIPSFQDRIISVSIPYILDYNTEVNVYKNKFGKNIEANFLPRILQNVAKIIISSRLNLKSDVINSWIKNPGKYVKYLDKDYLLLKMEIYSGEIPKWLDEEDLRGFDKEVRRGIINLAEEEGNKGISGRQSLNIFNDLYTKYTQNEKMITMENIRSFFVKDEELAKTIPIGFIDSLVDMYDFNVLAEVKSSIYYYNKKQISRDIQNYLFSINFELGTKQRSEYTGDDIEITIDLFNNFEYMILGSTSNFSQLENFRKDILKEYLTTTLSQEIRLKGMKLTETDLYLSLFEKYTKNLKENALSPYSENENFRRAILDYSKVSFKNYDKRLKQDVKRLLNNLVKKYGYDLVGAQQVCLYVIDKGLDKIYD